jgi:hypothetical protein
MPARCQPETNVGLGDRESAQSSGAAWPGVELRREPDNMVVHIKRNTYSGGRVRKIRPASPM